MPFSAPLLFGSSLIGSSTTGMRVFHLVTFCVILLKILLLAESQHTCTISELLNDLDNIVARSMAIDFGPAIPTVRVLDHNIVCLNTARRIGRYAATSIVVNYTCSGSACPRQSE